MNDSTDLGSRSADRGQRKRQTSRSY